MTLSPQCKFLLKLMLKSNVSKLIQQDFSFENHSAEINAEFDVDSITFIKLKEILVEEQK